MHPLKSYLQEQGLTIKGFARRVETSAVYLHHIMAGRATPSLRFTARLVAASGGRLAFEDFLLPACQKNTSDVIQK